MTMTWLMQAGNIPHPQYHRYFFPIRKNAHSNYPRKSVFPVLIAVVSSLLHECERKYLCSRVVSHPTYADCDLSAYSELFCNVVKIRSHLLSLPGRWSFSVGFSENDAPFKISCSSCHQTRDRSIWRQWSLERTMSRDNTGVPFRKRSFLTWWS